MVNLFEDLIGAYVVIRSVQSGVHMGVLRGVDGDKRLLSDARRVWHWTGAASCTGLANEGPSGGKITTPAARIVVDGCCETIQVTEAAKARFDAVAPWKV